MAPAAKLTETNALKGPPLGAHQSIAGGYYKAVELASRSGCQCVQLFTKNNNQWAGKPITDADAKQFQQRLAQLGITHPLSHDSYLINLAAPNDELWNKSIEAFTHELERAEQLGIPYVVTHPGAYTSSSEEEGLRRIVTALDEVHRRAPGLKTVTLLETTAGQGTCLGARFEHLQFVLEGVKAPQRVAVCVDTCHIFAAGYPFGTAEQYAATIDALDRAVGLDRVKAFHFNDSKKELGSRVDRHEHIGRGKLGLEPFRLLLNDRRFREVPVYLETPKEDGDQVDSTIVDAENLRVLRSLIHGRASVPFPSAP